MYLESSGQMVVFIMLTIQSVKNILAFSSRSIHSNSHLKLLLTSSTDTRFFTCPVSRAWNAGNICYLLMMHFLSFVDNSGLDAHLLQCLPSVNDSDSSGVHQRKRYYKLH
uniref:Uncharacterized protein n=1 Tax=Glossina palpalis gambiensis TaxID=67801 RepID=A0A1B0BCR2_9MUSC